MGRYQIVKRVAWTRDGAAFVMNPSENEVVLDDDVAAELGDAVHSLDRPDDTVPEEPKLVEEPKPGRRAKFEPEPVPNEQP